MSNEKFKEFFLRLAILVIGLLIMSFGITVYLKAGLGANPLTTFTSGFAGTFNMTQGQASQVVMIFTIIVIFFIDKRRIGIGTIINAIFTGVFIDLFMNINFTISSLRQSIVVLIVGIFMFAIGLGMYVSARLGEGAIDAIMVILTNKFDFDLQNSRIILDIALVVIGFLLGGDIGLGTIFGIIFTGPIMSKTIDVIKIIGGKENV